MKASLQQTEKSIELSLSRWTSMGSISRDLRALLAGPVFQAYREAQDKRWATQNQSEGSQWPELNKKYKAWKEKKYAEYPGAGKKMMLRTTALYESMVNPNGSNQGRKIVGPQKLWIVSAIPYAKYANQKRNFTRFGDKTMIHIKKIIVDYVNAQMARGGK